MSDHLPSPAPDPDSQAIAQQAAAQPGSLLRLRDVQALNRSFRRLAEVQEALLVQMEALEEERRRVRSWNAPLYAIGGTVLGLGLAAIAFVWWQGRAGDGRIVVQGDPPSVTVQPPAVTVESPPLNLEVPRDPALEQMVGVMQEQMSAFRADQAAARDQLREMTERLYDAEQEKLRLLERISAQPRQPAAEPPPSAPAAGAGAAGADAAGAGIAPADPWVGVVNGLLATDGYPGMRFQRATRVLGEPRLDDVVMMEWGADGLASAVVRAGRVDFELHRMLGNLVIRFRDGFRTADGARVALPAEGLRVDLNSVNVRAWLEHFPELAETGVAAAPPEPALEAAAAGAPAGAGAAAPAKLSTREVQRELDNLISRRTSLYYYKLSRLGDVQNGVLQMVQINWHDNSGRLVKTIEADSLTVRLHEKGSSVELEMRNGAFLDGAARNPFSSDTFRLFLPRQDLAEWRASGVPYVEAAG